MGSNRSHVGGGEEILSAVSALLDLLPKHTAPAWTRPGVIWRHHPLPSRRSVVSSMLMAALQVQRRSRTRCRSRTHPVWQRGSNTCVSTHVTRGCRASNHNRTAPHPKHNTASLTQVPDLVKPRAFFTHNRFLLFHFFLAVMGFEISECKCHLKDVSSHLLPENNFI